MEARGFRRALPEFREFDVEVIGISGDRATAQARFADEEDLTFPMLCDIEGQTIRDFGVRSLLGFAKRVTFFVDEFGRVLDRWDSVSAADHAQVALEAVRSWASSKGLP